MYGMSTSRNRGNHPAYLIRPLLSRLEPRLSGTGASIWEALTLIGGNRAIFKTTYKEIMETWHVSKATARRGFQVLERRGLIERKQLPHGVWQITMPHLG